MVLFGIPDEAEQTVHYKVEIPKLLSVLVYDDPNKPVQALDSIPKEDHPPVLVPFFTYRLMIGCGVFFLMLSCSALVLTWKKDVRRHPWLLKLCVFSVIPAYLANEAGWVSAEMGRQPWMVYGLLRTEDGLSKSVHSHQVLSSIVMFGIVYALLFVVWVYVMNEKIQHGPFVPSHSATTAEEARERGLTGA